MDYYTNFDKINSYKSPRTTQNRPWRLAHGLNPTVFKETENSK